MFLQSGTTVRGSETFLEKGAHVFVFLRCSGREHSQFKLYSNFAYSLIQRLCHRLTKSGLHCLWHSYILSDFTGPSSSLSAQLCTKLCESSRLATALVLMFAGVNCLIVLLLVLNT